MALEPGKYTDEEKEYMIKIHDGMRKMILDRKPHIKEYYKARKLHSSIMGSMLSYYEKGQFKPEIDMKGMAKARLTDTENLIDREITFDLATTQGMHVMAELFVFKFIPYASCITEEYIKKKRFRTAEKQEFLQCMMDSSSGLFELVDTDELEGRVTLRNVLTNEEQTIVDIGLSNPFGHSDFVFFARIITYRGISFNTGLAIPFRPDDEYMLKQIRRMKKEPNRTMSGLFLDLYTHYKKARDKIELQINEFR